MYWNILVWMRITGRCVILNPKRWSWKFDYCVTGSTKKLQTTLISYNLLASLQIIFNWEKAQLKLLDKLSILGRRELRLYVNNPPIHYDLRVRLLRDYKNFADLRFQFYALSAPLPLLWAAPHWHGSTGRCGNNSVSGQQVNDCFVGGLQWRRQCSETNHH